MAKRVTIKASNGMELTCIVYRASKTTKWFGTWKYAHRVVIINQYGEKYHTTFYDNDIEPRKDTPIEVLDCIFNDAFDGSYSEEEYYREFGSPEDYKDARKSYLGCVRLFNALQRLGFTTDDMCDTINIIRNILED